MTIIFDNETEEVPFRYTFFLSDLLSFFLNFVLFL